MRKQKQTRRGTVAVMTAVCLVLVLTVVAIAIDGGLLLDNARRVQAVADTAAFSAAEDLYLNARANKGLDPNGSAVARAVAITDAAGYPTPIVNIPPASGAFAGRQGYVEVIVTTQQKRYFSRILGKGDLPVGARAVAEGRWAPFKTGILVLDPTKPGALTDTGGGVLSVLGVPTIVNSKAPDAATATGNGTVVSSEFDVTGVPAPAAAALCWTDQEWSGTDARSAQVFAGTRPKTMIQVKQQNPLFKRHAQHSARRSTRGIDISGQATLNMAPGIYYMDGGGFSFTGRGSLNATAS